MNQIPKCPYTYDVLVTQFIWTISRQWTKGNCHLKFICFPDYKTEELLARL